MSILRAEAKAEGKTITTTVKKKSSSSSQQPTGIAALSSKIRKKAQEVKTEVRKGPEVVKSSFCAPAAPLPELGPATTEAELNDLLDAIDKEIQMDPELSGDLLELLADEEDIEMMEEGDEEVIAVVPQASGYAGPLPDYLDDSELHSCDDTQKTEDLSGGDLEEEDPEMVEMLKMLDQAKGDLEGAKEDELAHLMEHFDNEEMFLKKLEEHKLKKATLKRKESATDQEVPKSKGEEVKKQKVVSPLDIIRASKARAAVSSTAQPSSKETGNSIPPVPQVPRSLESIAIQPDAEEKPISFDQEANTEVISTPTKGRVAPPRNRRPPTRKRPGADQITTNNNSNDMSNNNNDHHACDIPENEPSMPESSPGTLKKKKKFKKKGAPVGGVSVFGGTDLFAGKNPFAGRKVDPSSSEDEAMEAPAPAQKELRLPFGSVPSDAGSNEQSRERKTSGPARKISSTKKPEDRPSSAAGSASSSNHVTKKQEDTRTPEEKSLEELKMGVKRLESWCSQKLAFAQDNNVLKAGFNIDAQISEFNVVEAELSAQVYAVKGLDKRGNEMITQGHPAVQEIKQELETLNKAWSDLQKALFQKKQNLEEALSLIPFIKQCDDFLLWIKEKTVMLSSKEFQFDAQKATILTKKLNGVKSDMKKHEAQLKLIDKTAGKLVQDSHPQAKDVTAKQTKVHHSWESLQATVRIKESQMSGASEIQVLSETMKEVMNKIKHIEDQLPTETEHQQNELAKSVVNLEAEVVKVKQSVDNYLFQHTENTESLRYISLVM